MFAQAILQAKSVKQDGNKVIITSEIDGIAVEVSATDAVVTPGLFYVVSGQPQLSSNEDKSKKLTISYGTVLGTAIASVPKVTLILQGRLGKDIEMKFFDSGKSVGKTSLAVSHGRDVTSWFNLAAWEKTADIMTNYTKKGDMVLVSGRFSGEKSRTNDKIFDTFTVERVQLSPKFKPEDRNTASPTDDYSDPGF